MPLDDRLRTALHDEATRIAPDLERHLAVVRGRRRRTSTSGRAVALISVMAIVLLAWGVAVDPLDSLREPHFVSAPAASAGPLDDASIVGTYRLSLDDGDGDGVVDGSIVGDWELTLGPASRIVVVAPDGFAAAHGATSGANAYAIDGDLLHTNLFARQLRQECAGPGTYRWHLDDGRLALEKVSDTCRVRVAVLTSREWSRDDS